MCKFWGLYLTCIGLHALCDFPLQNSYLAENKRKFPLLLFYHSAIYSVITHIPYIFLYHSLLQFSEMYLFSISLNLCVHMAVDHLKNINRISLKTDQATHLWVLFITCLFWFVFCQK